MEPPTPALDAPLAGDVQTASTPASQRRLTPPDDPLTGADRLLVVRADNIGDVVLTSPLFRALRSHLSSARLGLLASPAGAGVAPLLPWVDEVVVARPAWQRLAGSPAPEADPALEERLIERLRLGRWDAAIIATSWNQTAWPPAYAAFLAGIPTRIGFASDFGGVVLSHPIEPPPRSWHAARRNLRLAEPFGISGPDALEVAVPEAARRSLARRLAMLGIGVRPATGRGSYVLAVPGASAPSRRIAPGRLGAAAAAIGEAAGLPVVVAGTHAEVVLVEACVAAAPGARAVAPDLSVPEFAALIEGAAVVVCCNSSAMHLADALDRPVVVAFAGTDLEEQWAPRRAASATLSVPVPCSPCYRVTCPIGNACLEIEPPAIADAALRLLDDPGAVAPRSAACAA